MSEAGAGLETLREILKAWFEPVPAGAGDLILTGADALAGLGLDLGSEVTVAGYVTSTGVIHRGGPGREGDLSLVFTLDLGPGEGGDGLVCKLPGATDAQKALLDDFVGTNELVEVQGLFRCWLERPRPTDRPPHVFEVQPVRRVALPGGDEFPAPVLDSPLGERWRLSESVKADYPLHRFFEPPVLVSFDGYELVFSPGERVEPSFVAIRGQFARLSGDSFSEGKPYVFHLQAPMGRKLVGVTAVAIPGTPAYEECRQLHADGTGVALTAVGLRALHLPHLLAEDARYDVIMCPVYRLERS